ncbi:MAG: ethanolamine ammonia-lyase reactivating factor EutA [Candidatus Obscuribacterales bacterium]|nr:ethanolamine ammonia-lyase reactivating factor EutA [Candidatus Obscuribacterales bacterium]
MPAPTRMKSIGIDIGTTTTHLVVSELVLANISTENQVPRLQVVERKILFQSRIHLTPLDTTGAIDASAVAALVTSELASADFSTSDIQTGAVIITGESAKKRNAKELAKELADQTGDFVVAAAGPHLESLLSGKGAGAAAYSKDNSKTICNIDIGGGTTNFSVFKNGRCIDQACLGIGGRFIQLDENFLVKSMTDSAEDFLDGVAKLKLVKVGRTLEKETAQLFCNLLSEVIMHACTRKKTPQIVQRLMQTDALKIEYEVDEYWFSGGVADCMMEPREADIPYGDMGNLLARALLQALAERELRYKICADAIRATVIGAGTHSLQISGHTVTVWATADLPLKNVRIIRPFDGLSAHAPEAEIRRRLASALGVTSNQEDQNKVAIVIDDLSHASYEILNRWAAVFASEHASCKTNEPLIILCEMDVGLALGQSIRKNNPNIRLIVLDNVDLSYGDYIDIGTQLGTNSSVPVAIKTLIFNS